jgi:uncharacterized protein
MFLVAAFSLTKYNAGVSVLVVEPGRVSEMAGYLLTFVLGIYGGFFSGGYVALLTAVFVAFFGMTFLEAVAVTKVLNLFSSLAMRKYEVPANSQMRKWVFTFFKVIAWWR